jgi:hypothetical protein
MTVLVLLAALATTIPKIDIENLCRGETSIVKQATAYESCVMGERTALKTLQDHWANYPASVRNPCANLVKIAPNAGYVELSTCIEIRTYAGASNKAVNEPRSSTVSAASPPLRR